jgi:predicted site-specific integrase-resolvase
MNKWKIAFWICFCFLIGTALFGTYSILDQGVTITYERVSYADTENDLKELVRIINETNLSKSEIKSILKSREYLEFAKDSISLNRVTLCFRGDQLKRIKLNW